MTSTDRAYWGGTKVSPANIYQLKADTFAELVERYYNIPVLFSMTRKEFLAHPDRDRLKDGPYVCSCTFKDADETRSNANADQLTLVILDLDEGDFVRTFAEAPESVDNMLHPYNFVLYQTAKHTPDAPRLKLVVDVEPCDPQHHRRLVAHVLKLLAAPSTFKGITESTTLSQAQYRPIQFQNEDYSAILAKRTMGEALTIAHLPDDEDAAAPDPDAREYAYHGLDSSLMGLAYLPLQGITVEDIAPALAKIDPDCSRPTWVKMGMALRHQFRDENSAREAFDLWDAWSSRGSKYKDQEPFAKWKSFRPDATGREPVTIRSLFKEAQAAGWDFKKVNTKVKVSIEEWIKSCEDVNALMEEGTKRISAMPFKNVMMEDQLIQLLQKRILQLGGDKFDKSIVRSQVQKERRDVSMEVFSKETPGWLSSWVYIATENVFRNAATGKQLVPAAFDNNFSVKLMPKDEDSEQARSGRPAVLPVHYALNQVKILRVDETIYYPLKGGNDKIVTVNGSDYLNTYVTSNIPAQNAANSQEAGDLLTAHVGHLIQEPEYREVFMQFLCHLVQFPGKKIRWAPLIQSAEGAGKGLLGKIMMGVLGADNVNTVGPEVLKSQWNDWMFNYVLIIVDEIYIPGFQREIVMNNMKMGISDDWQIRNKRNSTAIKMPNFGNYIGFTNYLDALHLKPSDRRWGVFQSGLQTDAKIMELNATGHFDRVERLLTDLAGGLRHWMMNYSIPSSFPVNGPAPKTKYRDAVIHNSKNPMLVRIENIIEDNTSPYVSADVVAEIELERLVRDLSKNNHSVSHYLRLMGYERAEGGNRCQVDGHKSPLWVRSGYDDEILSPDDLLELRVRNAMEKDNL